MSINIIAVCASFIAIYFGCRCETELLRLVFKSVYRSAVELNTCVYECMHARTRSCCVCSLAFFFSQTATAVQYAKHYNLCVCTQVSAEIWPADVRRVLFSFSIAHLFYKYTLTHTHTHALTQIRNVCVCPYVARMHFFGTHSFLFVLFRTWWFLSVCAWFCFSVFAQLLLTACVCVFVRAFISVLLS